MEESQDLGTQLEEMTETEGLEHKFILVHKSKSVTHTQYAKETINPDQAANVADWWWSW